MIKAILIIFGVFIFFDLRAQIKETIAPYDLFTILSKRFNITPIDTSFKISYDGIGYENKIEKIKIICKPFPTNFTNVKNQFNSKRDSGSLLIDTLSVQRNNLCIFFIICEEVAPPNSRYENYISITGLVDFNPDYVVDILAVFPKSKDSIFRNKIMDSYFTIRELAEY